MMASTHQCSWRNKRNGGGTQCPNEGIYKTTRQKIPDFFCKEHECKQPGCLSKVRGCKMQNGSSACRSCENRSRRLQLLSSASSDSSDSSSSSSSSSSDSSIVIPHEKTAEEGGEVEQELLMDLELLDLVAAAVVVNTDEKEDKTKVDGAETERKSKNKHETTNEEQIAEYMSRLRPTVVNAPSHSTKNNHYQSDMNEKKEAVVVVEDAVTKAVNEVFLAEFAKVEARLEQWMNDTPLLKFQDTEMITLVKAFMSKTTTMQQQHTAFQAQLNALTLSQVKERARASEEYVAHCTAFLKEDAMFREQKAKLEADAKTARATLEQRAVALRKDVSARLQRVKRAWHPLPPLGKIAFVEPIDEVKAMPVAAAATVAPAPPSHPPPTVPVSQVEDDDDDPFKGMDFAAWEDFEIWAKEHLLDMPDGHVCIHCKEKYFSSLSSIDNVCDKCHRKQRLKRECADAHRRREEKKRKRLEAEEDEKKNTINKRPRLDNNETKK